MYTLGEFSVSSFGVTKNCAIPARKQWEPWRHGQNTKLNCRRRNGEFLSTRYFHSSNSADWGKLRLSWTMRGAEMGCQRGKTCPGTEQDLIRERELIRFSTWEDECQETLLNAFIPHPSPRHILMNFPLVTSPPLPPSHISTNNQLTLTRCKSIWSLWSYYTLIRAVYVLRFTTPGGFPSPICTRTFPVPTYTVASLGHTKHHHSCTMGPSLSRIRVGWTQALWRRDSGSDNWDGC